MNGRLLKAFKDRGELLVYKIIRYNPIATGKASAHYWHPTRGLNSFTIFSSSQAKISAFGENEVISYTISNKLSEIRRSLCAATSNILERDFIHRSIRTKLVSCLQKSPPTRFSLSLYSLSRNLRSSTTKTRTKVDAKRESSSHNSKVPSLYLPA